MTAIEWRQGEILRISGQAYLVVSRTTSGDVNLLHIEQMRCAAEPGHHRPDGAVTMRASPARAHARPTILDRRIP
jgi:hypothetical protein